MTERKDIIRDISFKQEQPDQAVLKAQDAVLNSRYISDFDQVVDISYRSEDGKIYSLNPVKKPPTQNSTYVSKVSMYEVGIFKRVQRKKPQFRTPIIYDL